MTGYQGPQQPHPTHQMQKPPKGWFARNWWWFLTLIIGGPIFCCCGGGGLMVYMTSQKINQLIEDNPAYKQAMTLLESNPEVAQELGTPITVPSVMELMSDGGGSKNVSVSNTGNSTTFDANIPVTGPNGSGTLVIVAEDTTNNGTWTFKELYLETESGERIELDVPGGLPGGMPEIPDLPEGLDGQSGLGAPDGPTAGDPMAARAEAVRLRRAADVREFGRSNDINRETLESLIQHLSRERSRFVSELNRDFTEQDRELLPRMLASLQGSLAECEQELEEIQPPIQPYLDLEGEVRDGLTLSDDLQTLLDRRLELLEQMAELRARIDDLARKQDAFDAITEQISAYDERLADLNRTLAKLEVE